MSDALGSRLEAQGDRKFPFEDLDVWRISLDFSAEIYRLTQQFPKDEIYGLTSQIRRASVSIASNIAEGKGRYSRKDFRNFLYIARGSVYEVITQLQLAHKIGYIPATDLPASYQMAHQIISKLSGLIRSLEDSVVSDANLEPTAWSLEQ